MQLYAAEDGCILICCKEHCVDESTLLIIAFPAGWGVHPSCSQMEEHINTERQGLHRGSRLDVFLPDLPAVLQDLQMDSPG
jgi:hypothetical protein